MTDMPRESDLRPSTGLRRDALRLPNLLTFLRVAAVPFVLGFLYAGTPEASFWAAMIYIGSTVTDFLDGWLARRSGQVSLLGKYLDPLADKILVTSTLVFLCWMGRLPLLGVIAVLLILGRELAITSLRTLAISEGLVLAAGQGGKEKTALQMVALLCLILHFPYAIDLGFGPLWVDLGQVGLALLYLSLVFALTSGGAYVRVFVAAVEAKERRTRSEGSGLPGNPDAR